MEGVGIRRGLTGTSPKVKRNGSVKEGWGGIKALGKIREG